MATSIRQTTLELIASLPEALVRGARAAVRSAADGYTGHTLELEQAIDMFKAGRMLAGSDRESQSERKLLEHMMDNYGLPPEICAHVVAFDYEALLEDGTAAIAELAEPGSVTACYIFAAMITIAEVDNLSDVELRYAKKYAKALGINSEIMDLIIAETIYTQLALRYVKLGSKALRPLRAELLTRMADYLAASK